MYDEARYKEVVEEVGSYLKRVGSRAWKQIPFIPVSGLAGDNLIENSTNMPWYKGPCLLEALENVNPPKRPSHKPLRLPLRDVYKIGGIGTVVVGRVETGILKVGMTCQFAGHVGSHISSVQSIEMYHESLQQAFAGDCVGFNVMNIGKSALRPVVKKKTRFFTRFLAARASFGRLHTNAAAQAPPSDASTLSTRPFPSKSPVKTLTSEPKPRFCTPL